MGQINQPFKLKIQMAMMAAMMMMKMMDASHFWCASFVENGKPFG
jgi:hypothetical protein